jgi:hypothetical protein
MGFTFDYTTTQIDGTPNEKICKQTTFCPTDAVRHTVVDSAGVALDQIHWDDPKCHQLSKQKGCVYDSPKNFFQNLISPSYSRMG